MAVLLSLLVLACDPVPVPGWPDPEPAIFYGEAPDRPEHRAVVALLPRDGSRLGRSPFCSGTLVEDRLVVTAAHCTEGLAGPGAVAVYLGDAPGTEADLSAHVVAVEAVAEHPAWRRDTLAWDVAVLRLARAAPVELPRIPPLPEALGFTGADVGRTVDIAGFGYQQDGTFGEKLHVEVPIAGFGCRSAGSCGGLPDLPALQVAYRQPGPPGNGGPCNGDSGGPMFLERAGQVYLAGVTSWGGASCRDFGVSARVDAAATWLEAPFELPDPVLDDGIGPTINEILPDPLGADAEGEWVEILNVDTAAQSLAGWTLVDAAGHVFDLPAAVLAPGEARVVRGALSLNNGPERIDLVTPGGTVLESVAWEAAPEGTSLNRRVDGDWGSPMVPHPEAFGAIGPASPGVRVDGSPW